MSKHHPLRHSFIRYRVARVQSVAQVALEAGNSHGHNATFLAALRRVWGFGLCGADALTLLMERSRC